MVALALLALFGHAALWVGIDNRVHATGLARRWVKLISLAIYVVLVGVPLAVAADVWRAAPPSGPAFAWPLPWNAGTVYAGLCAVYGAAHVPRWAFERWQVSQPLPAVRQVAERTCDVATRLGRPPAGDLRTRLFARLPFNEIWRLRVLEYRLTVGRLPAALEGLSICHLSDFHVSGRIERPYFEEVVRLTNELAADVVVFTGDLCDKADHIEWMAETFGRIRAPLGKYYILGNHDLRTHAVERLRHAIRQAGFIDVSRHVEPLADRPAVIAGNEAPWFPLTEPHFDALPAETLRILLAHSPDQLTWARDRGFDLMLAGHTHGGQICFPLVGAVVCPSWHGTRYACGFFEAPPTLMHVSRGTSTHFPYRLNCPPEITKLVLSRAG
jgi:predicted MPP superfamily phosphohydrolase